MNLQNPALYNLLDEEAAASMPAREQYEQRLNEYILMQKMLIRQKELLEERQQRILHLRGRYNMK